MIISAFDIHATLESLAKFGSSDASVFMEKSLFHKFAADRTCENAGISTYGGIANNFCTVSAS